MNREGREARKSDLSTMPQMRNGFSSPALKVRGFQAGIYVKGSLPLLCRSSRSVSWPHGAFQGVRRLSSGPGGERQGCPKQKGADGGQVEVRLVQIDLMTRMREIQQGRVGQGRLVLPGDRPFDIVTGSGQNQ